MTSNENGVFVPPDALFPDVEATEATMEKLLRPLGRDAVLVACARLNTVVSGTGVPDIKVRQQRAIDMICSGEDLDRINAFAKTRPSGDLPVVFFRGQLLELMRWAARCCDATVGAESLEDPAGRSRLLQAALIASKLWGERVFAGRLSGVLPVDDARKLALGAFRRGFEESAIAPHIGATLGRGWALFSEHFPRHYPDFAAEFLQATGLTVEQYFTCVTGLALYLPFDTEGGALYFDEIQDVKVTKDMLDLARHIVEQKAGRSEPDKFEDQYETALVDLINQKRAGKPITPKEAAPRRERRRPDGGAAPERER